MVLNAVREEVEDLHRAFVACFTGAGERAALMARFDQALDEGMRFISPDGARLRKSDLMSGFQGGFGGQPDIEIAVTEVEVLHDLGDHLLISYIEWQRGGARGVETSRLTTALLTQPPFRWLHVHETWAPAGAVSPFGA